MKQSPTMIPSIPNPVRPLIKSFVRCTQRSDCKSRTNHLDRRARVSPECMILLPCVDIPHHWCYLINNNDSMHHLSPLHLRVLACRRTRRMHPPPPVCGGLLFA